MVDFSAETLGVRREWDDKFKLLKEKKKVSQEYYTEQNYPPEMKTHIKSLPNKQKLRELITIRHTSH